MNTPFSGLPTQSELNQPIEEQANPRGLDPTQQQPQEEEPPSGPITSPELPEKTSLTTTTSFAQIEQGLVAWEILVDQDEQETIPTGKHQYELQVQLAEPIVFAASSDPDILYLHQAMKAPDHTQFIKAMEREIKGHEEGNHWVLSTKSQESWMQFGPCDANVALNLKRYISGRRD